MKPDEQSIWTYIPFERQFYALKIWCKIFFSLFQSLKLDGGLNVTIKVWIVKTLSNFKHE